MEERPKSRKLIGEFLLELMEDGELQKKYEKDPDGTLAESGLTEEQQSTLKSKNFRQIRDAVRDEYGRAEVLLMPMFFFASPGEDDKSNASDGSEGSEGSE